MAKTLRVELSMREAPGEAQAQAEAALKAPARAVALRQTQRGAGELAYRPRIDFPFLVNLWHHLNREQMTVTSAEGSQCRPAVGPWITHSRAPIGNRARASSQGSSCRHAQRSIPTSRRLPPFPRRTRTAPRALSRSLSLRSSASPIRSPARQSSTIRARRRCPSARSPAARINAMISSTVGGSAG